MEAKFNTRNPAVKRIMQEIKEIQSDDSRDFIAEALENDIFEWHFVIRGPPDTEFEGGVYHGRILLPPEYPFKPPAFMMLTPSGRFETNVKICLSISSHHPEHWQPSWSVRTALTALIAFMPSPGQGALGSLDFTKDERRVLAARARREAPSFGSAERQRVITEMHQRMIQRMDEAEAAKPSASGAAEADGQHQAEGQRAEGQQAEGQQAEGHEEAQVAGTGTDGSAVVAATAAVGEAPGTPSRAAAAQSGQQAPGTPGKAGTQGPAPVSPAPSVAATPASATPRQGQASGQQGSTPGARPAGAAQVQVQQVQVQQQSSDQGLTMLAVALSICIAAVLLRKVIAAYNSLMVEDAAGDGLFAFFRR